MHKPLNQSHLPIMDRAYPDIEGTVMAFDFGEKRIGIAIGETLLGVAHPLTTIVSEENQIRFKQIQALIDEWRPHLLIVGLPMYLNGDAHALTHLAKKFAQRLEGRFAIPVMMIDERLSSAEASQQLNAAGISGRAQKHVLDQVAAQTILQTYFNQKSMSTHETA